MALVVTLSNFRPIVWEPVKAGFTPLQPRREISQETWRSPERRARCRTINGNERCEADASARGNSSWFEFRAIDHPTTILTSARQKKCRPCVYSLRPLTGNHLYNHG